jgi:hypothetical protein
MAPIGRWNVGDTEVDEFVDSSIVSFAAWDLITYLNKNPSVCESVTDLAATLARQEADMMPAIRRLCETGVLVESPEPGGPAYRLTSDPAQRDVVARFVALSSKREFRLEFVRRVLGQITGG